MGTVIVLAGRRYDAADAPTPRFPLANGPAVQGRLGELFQEENATAMVSSAACGADLLALQAAGFLRMRRRVVLPFDRHRFRATSVTDRPGQCGPAYDHVIDEVEAGGDLVVIEHDGDDSSAYRAVTEELFNQAIWLAEDEAKAAKPGAAAAPRMVAVVVWEGQSRGKGDETARFAEIAEQRDIPAVHVITV
ncbi:MAG: hypothetical protein JSU87_13995, partial [Gemmatimonadota bacterium]